MSGDRCVRAVAGGEEEGGGEREGGWTWTERAVIEKMGRRARIRPNVRFLSERQRMARVCKSG